MISLLCALSVLGCSEAALGASPARDRAGLIHFARAADSSFDKYTLAPSSAQQAWMRGKYWRMRAYAPYFDSRTAWFSGAWAYKDAMAIYPGETKPAHWYLKDAQGRKLYIWWGCGGGTCSQYAADVGSPEFRRAWIDEAKAMYQRGYKGLFVDDVNMSLRISDGNGNLQWPVDPRTGATMTEANWKRYLAEFMEQLRRELPGAEIVHNSLWFDGYTDPYVQRQQEAADLIEFERGINDSGLRGGEGQFSVKTVFKMIDALHAKGKGVVLDAAAPTHAERLYGLAGYFLISDGRDALGNYQAGTPDDWWTGYDTDLGEALGPRYETQGVLRRDFSRGTVLMNVPDSPTRTVSLGSGYRDLDGTARSSVTLPATSGAVLLRTDAPAPVTPPPPANTETTVDPPTAPNVPTPPPAPTPTPTPPTATPTPTPTQTPTPTRKRPRKKPTASISSSGNQTSASIARVNGKRVKISGRVAGATTGKVKLVIQRKQGGTWKTVKTVAAALRKDGTFVRTVTAAAGNHRVQARFSGTKTAKASRSSYRAFSARR